jgi:hypothetical protein
MTRKQIDIICEEYNIQNYTINDDLSIDVYTNVNLSRLGLKELPLKFNNVRGYFNCNSNNLTSLPTLASGTVANNTATPNSLCQWMQPIGTEFSHRSLCRRECCRPAC